MVSNGVLIKKIALGTAQFGLEYGIANSIGKPSDKEVFSILDFAYKLGIVTLDTAYSYGGSEEIIGEFISQSKQGFKIISKLPNLGNNGTLEVESYCQKTLGRLKQDNIYGYLIHKFDDMVSYKGDLWSEIESLKYKGLVYKIGFSIYKTEELEYLLNNNISFDILQFPYNIFDQRFEEYFPILKEKGVEIYTRSVFLQGLFFLKADKIGRDFRPVKNMIEKLRQISADYKIPVHSLCLCFVMLNPFIDKVIIGLDSLEQLKQNINFIEYMDQAKDIFELLKSFKFHNEEVILPYNWK